ncbi:MAG TPA: hypothetical protein VHD90_15035 [Phototrophicaceae bacterium]|nr:hypothetical protein [Phototrophicaceae bacterium]
MKRLIRHRLVGISFLVLLLLGVWSVAAQNAPTAPPDPQAFPTLPLAASPTPGGIILATLAAPEQTQAPAAPETTQAAQATEAPTAAQAQPTAVPTSSLGVEQTEAIPVLIADRADLELLADTAIGSKQRPVGWSGSIDVTDPNLPLWIRLDLETLAGAVMGADKRPPGWFGVVPSVPLAIARDIRHDLELLADVVVGTPGVRPAGWKGDDPMFRCDRATQSLFTLLQSRGIIIKVDFTQPNYCDKAETAASLYVERQILQPPPAQTSGTGVTGNQGRYPFQVDNPFVVAFMDRNARQKIGVLPIGTGFQPIASSHVEFSNMMLIQGDGFQVFVDYTTTQVTLEQFASLPDVGLSGGTNCQADWCGKNTN